MPLDLISVVEEFWPVALLLAVGAWLGMGLQRFISKLRARSWRRRNASLNQGSPPASQAPTNKHARAQIAVEQLRIVMDADFTARPLLSQSEARVFEELCRIVTRCKPEWRVMAQVSLGEILRSTNSEAFSCVNSKRVDMLLVDDNCWPRHAIEYHGDGHYQGTAAARDAVKKEALRRAGIGYHEVVAGKTTPGELRQFIENLISKDEAVSNLDALNRCVEPNAAPSGVDDLRPDRADDR